MAGTDARLRPSFFLYLAALLLLPFKWFSPFSYAQAGLTDVFAAAAVACWAIENVGAHRRLRVRATHLCYLAYVLTVGLSALVSAERGATSSQNVLITVELVLLAVVSADYWRLPMQRRWIVRVILLVVLITAIEAVVGLTLFYLGDQSSLVTGYSSYFRASTAFTRVQGGFYSPALLGSFTIFASAVLALKDGGISRRTEVAAQVVLVLLAASTVSRPLIALLATLSFREGSRLANPLVRRMAAGVTVAAIVAAVALSVLPLSIDPLRPASSPAGINPRLSMIATASSTFAHHPLLGLGPGTLVARWQGAPLRAHLTPLNIAATTGILSLLPLVALIIILWRRRSLPTNIALWSGFAGLMFDGMTQDAEHFRHVWVAVGLLDGDRREPDQPGSVNRERRSAAGDLQPPVAPAA